MVSQKLSKSVSNKKDNSLSILALDVLLVPMLIFFPPVRAVMYSNCLIASSVITPMLMMCILQLMPLLAA